MANPEVVLTPDVLALPWLSNGGFVLLHVLLFHSAGFIGSVCVAKRYDASVSSLSPFWPLFDFNGYLSAHLGRLLPAVLYFPGKGDFITGYPDLGTLLDALTTLRWHDFAMLGSGPVRRAGWWEFDAYVGFTAFLLLVVCSVLALRGDAEHEWSLLEPAGLLGLLSLGNVFAVVASAPLPLVSVERVSSRFIAVPLVMSLILTMRGMDVWIRRWSRGGRIALLLGLPLVTVELLQHARLWQLARLERGFQNVAAPELGILPFGDSGYTISTPDGASP